MKYQCSKCKLWSRDAAAFHFTHDGEAMGACLLGRDDISSIEPFTLVKASHYCGEFIDKDGK